MNEIKAIRKKDERVSVQVDGKIIFSSKQILDMQEIPQMHEINAMYGSVEVPAKFAGNKNFNRVLRRALKKEDGDIIYYFEAKNKPSFYLDDDLIFESQTIPHNTGRRLIFEDGAGSDYAYDVPEGIIEIPCIPDNCIGYSINEAKTGRTYDQITYYCLKGRLSKKKK